MPKAFPAEFRADVVAIARKREVPMRQIAQDFGISESCLHRWVQQAEIDDGNQEGLSTKERDESESCANERSSLSRRTTSCAEPLPISVESRSQNEIPAGP